MYLMITIQKVTSNVQSVKVQNSASSTEIKKQHAQMNLHSHCLQKKSLEDKKESN
jgi:hypothetical protein